ncbi:MAG: M20/M25/M40 family metallo-hydrolase, partial [Clostridia bacterium]
MSEFDIERYSKTLSQMVQIKTVSVSDDVPTSNVDAFKTYLKERFPNVFKTMVERNFDGGIMLEWKGETDSEPLCLMSHFDVVDENGTWTIGAPFSGEIKDDIIIGRGTADTKGSLAAIFEAVEKLIIEGFKPQKSIYILSSSKEEVAGKDAKLMAQYFVDNKIVPSLLVDEGGAIMEKPIAGVEGEFAMMAMSERSSAKYEMSGDKENIEKFKAKLQKAKLAQCDFPPEISEMFRRLTPKMSQPMKFVFKHFNLFKGFLVKMLPKLNPSAGAMVKPTV